MKLLITALLIFSAAHAWSQTTPTDTSNTATTPSAPPKIYNFKADANGSSAPGSRTYSFDKADKKDAPQEATGGEIKTATFLGNYVGYPEREVFVALEPTDYAGKFTYSGVTFNYNSSTASATEVGFRESFNPDTTASISARFFDASTDAGTPGHFVVNASKVSMYDVMARGNFCIGDNFRFFSKLCPGFEIGLSSYPVLGFVSNTNLTMEQAKEIVVGPNFFAQIPLVYDVHWDNLFAVDFGTGVGQSGSLSSTKNIAYGVDSTIVWPIRHTINLHAGFNYQARSATIQGSNGTQTDTWNTTLGELSGRLAVGYLW